METAARQVFVTFNVCEGILWVAVAIGVLVVLWRKRQNPDLTILLAGLFATYGLSDWVEIGTGGWYKPWWMFTWKAANLVALALTLFLLHRRKRAIPA